MIKPICRDTLLLAQKSTLASPADAPIIQDLKDTLAAHADSCVGMAANMIGVSKRIIIVSVGIAQLVLVNPVIVQKSGAFEAEEGCLSLDGVRRVTRYRTISVQWLDERFQPRKQSFTGWTAQIIQHEVDHCDGVLI